MKFNFKGIKFRTWLYFLIFSVVMLGLLGFLLIAFIKPYYRANRIETINTIVDKMEEELLLDKADSKGVEETNKLVVGNNICAIIYNQNGRVVYESDSLGELCMFDDKIGIGMEEVIISREAGKVIDILSERESLSLSMESPKTGDEMLLYGKKISANLVNYYLLINTPLELLESYIDFILQQYLFVSLLIIGVALVAAFLLANRITNPIVKMRKEANKLAEGNYDVKFREGDSYTEINDLAATLDDATVKLSKVDELRKDLVANVSHDIKTPLTLIRSYAEMIKDISGEDPVKRNEHLDVILQETEYLTRLINDMQEYSKMQAGYIELNKSNFDLEEATETVSDLLYSLIEEKNITLKKDLVGVIVYADQIKISQVIYNFLSNAIKHSNDGGEITIRIIDSEEKVRFEVTDNGDGISEEALPYVWDRYYKIDKQFKRNENSTGLGLAIAKAILEGHKALYGVESVLGEGSTFWFELSKDYDNETE
ncbi:MAG: HAMP domain-containing histidine kinase [Erysipelotrichaceae bacterium]|nr:HAMP domain-containing histidine kinase [Erysipelotrichaceae bacterium]